MIKPQTMALLIGVAGASYMAGKAQERRRLARQLEEGRVLSVEDVPMPLSDAQREYLEYALQAGADVVVSRAANAAELLVRSGVGEFERMFTPVVDQPGASQGAQGPPSPGQSGPVIDGEVVPSAY